MKYQNVLLTIIVIIGLGFAWEYYSYKVDQETEAYMSYREYKMNYIRDQKYTYLYEPTVDSIYNALMEWDHQDDNILDTLYNRMSSYKPPIEEHKDHPNFLLLQIEKDKKKLVSQK